MKKIRTVIIRSNPVNPDSRVEKEAISLVKHGFEVIILCWDRQSNHKPECGFLNLSSFKIRIIRLGFKATFGEGFKNIIPYLGFQKAMRKWLKKNKKEYDIVHACDFDTAFFSYKLAKKLKKVFIFDIFDFLYGEPKNLLQKAVKKAQYKIINSADATIICTEKRKEQIKGSNPKKLVVIHNSPSEDQLPAIFTAPVSSAKIKICYVGILQGGRMLEEIGHFFEKNSQFEFHVGGFGLLESFFEELSNKYGNIVYYGKLPYEKTLSLESNSDIMLGIYDPSIENHRFAAPNKFYESLFLGKPIIMVKNTGMSEVVELNGFGCLMDFDIDSFENALNHVCGLKNKWPEISKRMKRMYTSEYSWAEMEKRLIELYRTF